MSLHKLCDDVLMDIFEILESNYSAMLLIATGDKRVRRVMEKCIIMEYDGNIRACFRDAHGQGGVVHELLPARTARQHISLLGELVLGQKLVKLYITMQIHSEENLSTSILPTTLQHLDVEHWNIIGNLHEGMRRVALRSADLDCSVLPDSLERVRVSICIGAPPGKKFVKTHLPSLSDLHIEVSNHYIKYLPPNVKVLTLHLQPDQYDLTKYLCLTELYVKVLSSRPTKIQLADDLPLQIYSSVEYVSVPENLTTHSSLLYVKVPHVSHQFLAYALKSNINHVQLECDDYRVRELYELNELRRAARQI